MIETALHLEDFSFDEDRHVYRDENDVLILSATQYMTLAGVYDFSMVPQHFMEPAKQRGKNVHAWTMRHDRALVAGASFDQAFDEADPLSISERELRRCEAWTKFVRDFKVTFIEIEMPMIRPVRGKKVAGTPDRIIKIDGRYYIIDLKTAAANHPGWAVQIAIYEMMRTRHNFLGQLGRISIRLPESGKYSHKVYDDAGDGDVAIAVLHPEDPSCRATVATWLANHKLTLQP